MMLHRMAFCLSGKVVALHLDNSTAKGICVIKMAQCLLIFPGWQILGLTYKQSITFIPAYIPTHLNVEADYLTQGWLLPKWHILLQMAQAAFCLWGLPETGLLTSCCTTQCQHYYTLETPLPLEALGLNAFNHPWIFQVMLCVSFSCISSSSSVEVSGRTCQRSTQTFDSIGTILDGGTLACHNSQYVGGNSLALSYHKRSHHGCFGRPCAQGSAISAFNPLAAWSVLCIQGFSSLVHHAVVGAT